MAVQEPINHYEKAEENSRLATLPLELQQEIRRCLQNGDFRTAKALFDIGIDIESRDKH